MNRRRLLILGVVVVAAGGAIFFVVMRVRSADKPNLYVAPNDALVRCTDLEKNPTKTDWLDYSAER